MPKNKKDLSYAHAPISTEGAEEYMYHMISCGHHLAGDTRPRPQSVLEDHTFFIVINGHMKVEYSGNTYEYSQDTIGLFPAGAILSSDLSSDCELVFFRFKGPSSEAFIHHLTEKNGSCVFSRSSLSVRLFCNIKDALKSICSNVQVTRLNKSILVYSALCMLEGLEDGHAALGSFSCHEVTMKLKKYIDSHLDEKITLTTLSKVANLSPAYLSKIVKKETGCSPVEYTSSLKIDYAKQMLRTTDTSVKEIAYFLGYNSPSGFINAFKARVGMSPTMFRCKD